MPWDAAGVGVDDLEEGCVDCERGRMRQKVVSFGSGPKIDGIIRGCIAVDIGEFRFFPESSSTLEK